MPLEMITADDHRFTLLSHRSAPSPPLRAVTDASLSRSRHPFFTLRRLNSEYDPGRRRARLRLRCERCATSVGWVPSSRVRVVSSRRRITSVIGRFLYSLCCVVSPCGSLPEMCLGIHRSPLRSHQQILRRSAPQDDKRSRAPQGDETQVQRTIRPDDGCSLRCPYIVSRHDLRNAHIRRRHWPQIGRR
jgi:hypothetical protein